ncbi:pilin [Acinetobacter pollinis]|uniref:pilin n=1 Tax=Acinetobacter pollinis TaxID=2605270 RepID=UPI001BB2F0E4|nr:pilin [Acinetobacter pollinis]
MQKGFTVIEVLIAIAIVAIISAIALVQYQIYVSKTQVNTVMQETASLKNPIDICLLEGQLELERNNEGCHLPIIASSLLTGNRPDGQSSAPNTGSPQITFPLVANQQIVGTFGNRVSNRLSGRRLVWFRDANSGTWTCRTDVDVSYRPNMCSQDL